MEEPICVEIKTPQLLAEAMAAAKAATEGGGNPTEAAEEIIKKGTIKLYFVSATRRQSYKRGDALRAAQLWLLKAAGVQKQSDIVWSELPEEILETWLAAWQAADIVGALHHAENWTIPAKPEEWGDVKDYIFNPALQMAWELNPQWANEQAQVPEGNS